MAFQTQDLMFGDFEALTQEERNEIHRILYGPKEERKVEFPWDDNIDDRGYGESNQNFNNSMDVSEAPVQMGQAAVQLLPPQIPSNHQQMHPGVQPQGAQQVPFSVLHPQEGLVFMTAQPMQVPATEKPGQQEIPQNTDQQFGQSRTIESNNVPKQYERRNKKKRPPDYYEKIEAELQAQKEKIGSWADSYPDDSNHGEQFGQNAFVPSQTPSFDPRQNYPQNIAQPVAGPPVGEVNAQQSNVHQHPQPTPPQQQNMNYYQQPTQLPWQPQVSGEVRNDQKFVQHTQQVSSTFGYEQHGIQQTMPDKGVSNVNVSANRTQVGEMSQQMSHLHVSAPVESCDQQNTSQPPIQSNLNSKPTENVTNLQLNSDCSVIQDMHSVPVKRDIPVNCADLENAMVHGPQGNTGPGNQQYLSHVDGRVDGVHNVCDATMNTVVQDNNSAKFLDKTGAQRTDLIPQQPESGASPNQNQPPSKPKSWAGLFKNVAPPSSGNVGVVITHEDSSRPVIEKPVQDVEEPKKAVSTEEDMVARVIGEQLSTVKINHAQVGLQPRGLVNNGNWCYINATLQALVACPPFYNLMKRVPIYTREQRGPSSTPILDCLTEFVHAFSPYIRNNEKGKGRKFQQDVQPGLEFEPIHVYKMLPVMQANQTFKLGRQEDAEEFLSCTLNGLHDEMSSVIRLASGKEAPDVNANGYVDEDEEEPEEDSWEQVGPKKKSVVTRKATFEKSPIADIFVGYTRSAVYKSSAKESANLQPFFTIQLDIQSEKVWSVRDALDGLVSKESISGYTCPKTKTEMEVARKTTLEELPPVLILHLKYFVYDKDGGCQKLFKKVDYTVDLEITKDLLSPNIKTKLSPNQRSYKLFAVVFHHGKQATGGGHYTTAVFHPAINGWILIDDNTVKPVSIVTVLKYSPPRVPYLLYYRRLDVNN